MEWFQGSSCFHKTALTRCFPKASAKVKQIFISANYFEDFLQKSREKIKHTIKICANTINSRLDIGKKPQNSAVSFKPEGIKTIQRLFARLK
jgi:hypothetical protein